LVTGTEPIGITAGPDGNLWFTEASSDLIGRITTAGEVTEFPISEFPIPGIVKRPVSIATGADGNLWFSEIYGGKIGRITTTGTVTEFDVPTTTGSVLTSIAAGPDGNLWFGEAAFGANSIGRMTTSGVVTKFTVFAANGYPQGITPGPDGNLWFTETNTNSIGRITTAGVVNAEFPTNSDSTPYGIAAGPDGNLWFTEFFSGKIGRITTAGVITEFPIPTAVSNPTAIAAGPDGNVWFAEGNGNKIGRVNLGSTGSCHADEHTLCLNNHRFAVTAVWQTTPTGPVAQANAVSITGETGYFWFLEPGNVEVVVKVLNACVDPFNSYWVFAAGLTNLGVSVTVTDTLTGASKSYSNVRGTPFQPILDTSGLKTCP
jgi:streptogramin lyase